MELKNIHGFATIDEFVAYKLADYAKKEKTFDALFEAMFSESGNIMAEFSDGYRVTKITYGEFKERILAIVPTVSDALAEVPKGEMVGLYMANSIEWIEIFWAILASGYSPLVMNTRLSDGVLEGILADYSVKAVISDGKSFSVNTVTKEKVTVPSDRAYEPGPFGKEVIFMSSGTTEKVKLCAYNGENFYYQVCDSAEIIRQCPRIKRHYEGELKQLVLLPLCHVFGFIAVYLWFGFFARTFVFPRDLNPDTIQRTVKKHKVTHIFAVPMVWEAVHKAVVRKVKERGASTYARFLRVSGLVNRLGASGDFLAARLLAEVREGLFGDSVQFLISGGSHIKPETLKFFNGIGYHLVNGYGMTEIGITSVEHTSKRKIANRGSIGAPFGYTEYAIGEEGGLMVRGKTRAARIMQNGESVTTDYEAWFATGDLIRCEGGRYFFNGRADDLLVGEDGENLNPTLAEQQLLVSGVDGVCVFRGSEGVTAVVSVLGVFSEKALRQIYEALVERLREIQLAQAVKKICFTHEALLRPGEFKPSRRGIAARIESGELRTFDPRHIDEHVKELESGIESQIATCFAEVLGKDVTEIRAEDDFFRDLGGTSLDYFTLLGHIRACLGIDVIASNESRLATVSDFAVYVKEKLKER